MPSTTRKVHAYITRLSLLIALTIAFGLPAGYWMLSYQSLAVELEIEARVNAEKVGELIEAAPEAWALQTSRLQELIGDDHTPTELPEYRRLTDEKGTTLAESEVSIGAWRITESQPLYDAGQVVGHIEIARDLQPLMARTALIWLLGLFLGGSVFLTLRLLPMRALRRAIDDLRAEKEKAEVTLASIADAVITTDAENRVTFLNSAAQSLTGLTPEEALNQTLADVTEVGPITEGTPMTPLRIGRTAISDRGVLRTRDGRLAVVEYSLSPIHDATQKIIGGVAVFRDITARQQAETALRELNDQLEDRVARRTQELQIARQQAEAANLAKSYFLANMSHEIRTPMNSVLGMTHLLLRTPLDERQRGFAEKIDTSGQHLLRLIDQILDLSKIEAGKLELERAPFNVHTLIANLSSLMWEKASAKRLQFSCDVDLAIRGSLIGDSLRLSQILINLCSNAIKFTEHGEVKVNVRPVGESADGITLCFEVSDTGIGISEAVRQRIFDPFQQADVTTTRRYGGTGLGLAISRQLTELMGGSLELDSTPGHGSCFRLTVWLAKGDTAASPANAASPSSTTKAPADLAAYRAILSGKRVLLTEDHPFNQEVATALLDDVGIVTRVADNGQKALELLEREPFDYVLMDVQMPVLDGFETTRRIRDNPALQDLFVIAMTANAGHEDRRRCLEAGMDDFLTKPVNPDRLYRMLVTMLGDSSIPTMPTMATGAPAASAVRGNGDLPVLDRATLTGLAPGDPARVARYVEMFCRSLDDDLKHIADALTRDDLAEIARLGHRIKGSARTLGAMRLGACGAALEALKDGGEVETARRGRQVLEDEFAAFRQAVDETPLGAAR